jgi:hypothetical protein
MVAITNNLPDDVTHLSLDLLIVLDGLLYRPCCPISQGLCLVLNLRTCIVWIRILTDQKKPDNNFLPELPGMNFFSFLVRISARQPRGGPQYRAQAMRRSRVVLDEFYI